jgi:long-chain acyl-CoA synthetase
MAHMALRVWGADVHRGSFGGHDGLTYEGLTSDEGPSTFEDLIAATEKWTDRTFLVHGEHRISFTEFRAAIGSARRIVDDLGIRSADRVMVFGYNSPEWVVALWALWLAGAVPVLANRWWSAAEIKHAVDLLAPRHVLADTELPADTSMTALADLRAAFDADSAHDVPPPLRPQDEPALILFTSGSSGVPKAVELSRRLVISNQHNILQRHRRLPHLLAAHSPQAVSLATTPMFHVGGLSSLLTHFLTGGKIVLAEGRFDAGKVLALIEREGVQIWGAVPTMAVRLLAHPDFDSFDLSSLRSWPLGGAPVTTDLLDRIGAKLPRLRDRGLSNTWGMAPITAPTSRPSTPTAGCIPAISATWTRTATSSSTAGRDPRRGEHRLPARRSGPGHAPGGGRGGGARHSASRPGRRARRRGGAPLRSAAAIRGGSFASPGRRGRLLRGADALADPHRGAADTGR